jgi:protein-S-isoprenylcysteine O-methyltransferase
LVRHPGYSGSLLVWIGAGMAVSNWIALTLVTLVCLIAYIYRIRSEEAMLVARFGQEYEEYRRRTKRLIPYLY